MADLLIAAVRKNAREHLQIAIREFKGYRNLDVRVYVDTEAGERVPTAKGISIKPALLDGLIAALRQAREAFQDEGALP